MKLTIYFIMIFLINSIYAIAEEDIRFNQVLHTEAYNSMGIQDKEGILWFATTNGLLKYNGYEKKFYKAETGSIPSNIVSSIYADSEGLIWIATINGLSFYDKKMNNFKSFFKSNASNSISSNQLNWSPNLISESKDGNIWIGTQQGVDLYDKENKTFKRYLESENIWSVFVDSQNQIWVGTQDNGIQKFNYVTEKFERILEIKSNWIYSIKEDKDNNLWIGTKSDGLFKLNLNNNNIKNYSKTLDIKNSICHNEVFSIFCDNSGKIWLMRTYKNPVGLECFDPIKEEFKLYTSSKDKTLSLKSNVILSLFQDNLGRIWIPENSGTVDIIDDFKPNFDSSNKIKNIMTIYEDSNNNVWIGTSDDGMYKINNKKELLNFNFENSKIHNYVFSILEENRNQLWLGTGDGNLLLFDHKNNLILEKYQNPLGDIIPRSLIRDSGNSNILWFSTEGAGIFKFNRDDHSFIQYKQNGKENSLSGNTIQRIVEDRKGNLWILTFGNGLNKLNKKTGEITNYLHDPEIATSISGNQVMDLFINSKEQYFVSTDDGGLNYFNPITEEFKRLGINQFNTNSIRSIKKDDEGYLWLTSDNGIFKYDVSTDKVLVNYTDKDGLNSNLFHMYTTASLKVSDGKIWFASQKGINIFDPSEIKINKYKPPIIITTLKRDGTDLVTNKAPEIVKKITLKYPKNYFEFEYAALNYTLSEKSKYKYKLEGFDKAWFDAGNRRFGRYSGLPGGSYTLRVMGTNNDGVWSDKEAGLKITVIPPFWQRNEFRIFIFLLGVYLFIFLHYLRTKAIMIQKEKLESLVNKRTNALNIKTNELKLKTEELNNKNIKLIDSLEYAERIQQVTFPKEEKFNADFKEFMLMFLPRDIVSGDFYWYSKQGDNIFIAVADCTGHGVPGAMLATIGNMLLNKYIAERQNLELDMILEKIDIDLKEILNSEDRRSHDGMDISLCKINRKENLLAFSGARNHLIYLTKNQEIVKINGTRRSLGERRRKVVREFEITELDLKNIESIYMFSDGYYDQLNEANKTLMSSEFFEIIEKNKDKSLSEQKKIFIKELEIHKNKQIQTDDITILAIKIN